MALAWVPFVAALALDDVRSTPLSLQLPLLALWLAFFPNAPYLVTDLIHIDPADRRPRSASSATRRSCRSRPSASRSGSRR